MLTADFQLHATQLRKHCAAAAEEGIFFEPDVLQHVHEQIWQRIVVPLVKGEVLSVSEAAAANKNRHVAVVMVRSVSKVAGQQDAGVVEHASALFL